jgi:hypothetical protein
MSWVNVAVGVGSAAAGVYGSQQAADAQGKGAKQARQLQQQNYNNTLSMIEPQRALGYGALSDLANLYNYDIPEYATLASIQGGWNQPITVKGRGGGGGASAYGPNPNPLAGLAGGPLDSLSKNPLDSITGSGGGKSFGGTINPLTGTVDVAGGKEERDALLTEYLRTGEWTGGKGGKMRALRDVIDRMRAGGYEYDPNRATIPTDPDRATASAAGGQPGNMSRFFASPDYQFRMSEAQGALDNTAAARGGALSGNAIRAQTGLASNMAAGEYGNYVNRLLAMAGLGQTATTQGGVAGQSYANNAGNLLQDQADSRASGILGGVNSAVSAGQNMASLYMLQRYLNQPTGQPTGAAPALSQYGPYANGYRFGG